MDVADPDLVLAVDGERCLLVYPLWWITENRGRGTADGRRQTHVDIATLTR